jgi:hypothetical protein
MNLITNFHMLTLLSIKEYHAILYRASRKPKFPKVPVLSSELDLPQGLDGSDPGFGQIGYPSVILSPVIFFPKSISLYDTVRYSVGKFFTVQHD